MRFGVFRLLFAVLNPLCRYFCVGVNDGIYGVSGCLKGWKWWGCAGCRGLPLLVVGGETPALGITKYG
jgi:hypothetical protein